MAWGSRPRGGGGANGETTGGDVGQGTAASVVLPGRPKTCNPEGGGGGGHPRDAIEGVGLTPLAPPPRAPSPCPATVRLTPSASLSGICNRQ